MKLIVCGMAWLAMGLFADQAARADGIRCGNKLASTGDSLYEVKAICGNPDDATHRVETHTVSHWVSSPCPTPQPHAEPRTDSRPEPRTECGSTVSTTIEVEVDELTYDFGSDHFIRFLRFENGRLVHISNGDYGKKPAA